MATYTLTQLRRQLEAFEARVTDLEQKLAANQAFSTETATVLVKLAGLLNIDGDGNIKFNLDDTGSFAVRQGDQLRIAVANNGVVALIGTDLALLDGSGKGGGIVTNEAGTHITPPGNSCLLALSADGRITAYGTLENVDATEEVQAAQAERADSIRALGLDL